MAAAGILALCTLCVVLRGVRSDKDELVMSNLLYRHGARSPIWIYPTDPYRDHWKDGTPGRLTQNGMNMEYNLGKFLKARYVDTSFVSQHYLFKEVTIRSSGVDRCLQSAEAQLAALYPPSDWQVWNKDIPWQPIPVQTVPDDEDPVLRPESTKDCPAYGELQDKMKADSEEYQKKVADSADLIEYLRKHTKAPVTVDNMWVIYDCVKSETAENLKQPQWMLDRLDEIRDLSWYLFRFRYIGQPGTADLLGRLTGGTLLGIMNNNMKLYVSGTRKEKSKLHKLNIFSAHDSTLLSLSAALGIEMVDEIPFAASVLVELFKTSNGSYYVEMTYKHLNTLTPWKLPDCDYKCPLDDFISKTKARVPEDRSKDCQTKPVYFSYKRLTMISVILLSLSVCLFVVIVFVGARTYHKKILIEKAIKYQEEKAALMS